MTQTLAVGDKVRMKSDPTGKIAGDFEITEVIDKGAFKGAYRARRPGGGAETLGIWYARELTKVEPEPAFKVGDRVIVERDVFSLRAGDVSTILRPSASSVCGTDREEYRVKNSGGPYGYSLHRAYDPQPAPPQGFALKAGDRIRNTRTGREGRVEPSGLHGTLKVFDLKPPFKDPVPVVAVEEYEDKYPNTYELLASEPW